VTKVAERVPATGVQSQATTINDFALTVEAKAVIIDLTVGGLRCFSIGFAGKKSTEYSNTNLL